MLHSYRVTKYDPKCRDDRGRYTKDDWTSMTDICKVFNGVQLTKKEYLKIENLYIKAITSFMQYLKIPCLELKMLSKWQDKIDIKNYPEINSGELLRFYSHVREGMIIPLSEVVNIAKLALRDELGCKLISQSGLQVHFGYDFYMYIISSYKCEDMVDNIKASGLFVESLESPYMDDDI